MKSIIQRYLHAKHWQVFVLLFVLPFVMQMIFMAVLIGSITNNVIEGQANPESIFSHFSIMMLFFVIYFAVILGWWYSIGIGLQPYIPVTARKSTTTFRVFLLIPIAYFLLLTFAMSDPLRFFPALLVLIIPLHFFTIFCMFYGIYFTSKTIKTAELQREVTFSDYAGEFFLMWFFPIGVWFLQPKVNAIINGEHLKQAERPMSQKDLLD